MANKALMAAAATVALAVGIPLHAQDGTWVETRFNRVHLRNGNFIDGLLTGDSPQSVSMRLITGEMSIRKDMIDTDDKGRLRIELIKMRSYQEAPKLASVQPLGAKPRPEPAAESRPATAPPPAPEEDAKIDLTGTIPEKIEQARGMLRQGPTSRKVKVLQALAAVGGPEVLAFVTSILESLEDEALPMAGAILTSGSKDAAVLSAMKSLLGSERAILREQAARVIGGSGNKDEATSLRPLLRDPSPKVRVAAIEGARLLGDTDSFDEIADNLTHTDSAVRGRSLEALGQFARTANLGDKLSTTLLNALRGATGEAKVELVVAIGKIGSPEMGPVLVRLTSDQDPMIRAHSIQGLSRFNATDYGQVILDLMDTEREYWPRIQLAQTAQGMKLSKSIDVLINWLGDSDNNIRTAASRALIGITNLNHGVNQQAWQEWREKTKQQ